MKRKKIQPMSGSHWFLANYQLPFLISSLLFLVFSLKCLGQGVVPVHANENSITVSAWELKAKSHPSNIRLRCAITVSHTSPLFIIDGTLTDSEASNALDPRSIETITVLNSSRATALFGCQGSEGAVVITTKKHKLELIIRDQEDSSLIAGATVSLFDSKDHKQIKSVQANDRGEATICFNWDKNYESEVSCIGYKNRSLKLTNRDSVRVEFLRKNFQGLDSLTIQSSYFSRTVHCGTICMSVKTPRPVSFGEKQLRNISVYPNPVPASGTIFIRLSEPRAGAVQIINTLGQLVQSLEFGYKELIHHLDLHSLSPGSYFLRMKDADQNILYIEKIIIQ